MVYNNKLVVVVKVDGNIIREDKDVVNIPFGSEYSILLKNLGMYDCVVNIDIDGKDVLSGNKIVVKSKESHELIGFLDGDSIHNKFKFIQKTDNIVKHRGDSIDDGFINISFQFQKSVPYHITWSPTYFPKPYYIYPSYPTNYTWISDNVYGMSSSTYCSTFNNIKSDEGVTVKGSTSNKKYTTISDLVLEEEKHSIIIRLKGYEDNKKPVFTNTKLICETCGRSCRSSMKFCSECGTSLL